MNEQTRPSHRAAFLTSAALVLVTLATPAAANPAPRARAGLVSFKLRFLDGKVDVDTAWLGEPGQWSVEASSPFAADVGARKNQPCVLYGQPNDNTALFVFDEGMKPRKVWESGPGNLSWKRSQVAAADFYGSGKNQIGVFYDAGKHNAALYVFDDAFALEKVWEQPAGWFDWPSSRLFVADLRGRGKDDFGTLYAWGAGHDGDTGMQLLGDKGTVNLLRMSPRLTGIKIWAGTTSKVVSADLDGTGKKQICFLHEGAGKNATLFVFDKSLMPHKAWESGPGQWDVSRSQFVAADLFGTGKEQLFVLYRHDDAHTSLFVFDDTFKPKRIWDGDAKWDWGHARFFAAELGDSRRTPCALAVKRD